MNTIYIQKYPESKEPNGDIIIGEIASVDCYVAYEGALKMGDKVIFFEDEREVPLSPTESFKIPLMVSSIEETIAYLERAGIEIPKPLSIPEELKSFVQRHYEIKTLEEFKKETELPIFVKPHSKLKTFPSGVIKNESSRRLLFGSINGKEIDQTQMVLVSEVVDMISEFRVFILRGEILDIQHYQGDPLVFPEALIIRAAIDEYKSAPVAYTLDFAVVKKNDYFNNPRFETVLIEANDAWAIGSYGMEGKNYLRMLKARWYEITR